MSRRMARINPPPCAPVAPTTAMVFLSDMSKPPESGNSSFVESISFSSRWSGLNRPFAPTLGDRKAGATTRRPEGGYYSAGFRIVAAARG